MSDCLISIIIPVYNAQDYIVKCLDSVSRQTYQNIEVILVNDGSTDGTWDIISDYVMNKDKFVAISKKNGGAAAARNSGLEIAKGEYITFVDADDFISKDYVSTLYDMIRQFDCKVSMVNIKMTSDPDFTFEDNKNYEVKMLSQKEAMYRCCNKDKIKITVIWGKLYHRSLFDHYRYPEHVTYEDLASTHQLIYAAGGIVETDQVLYAYYMSPNSVMRQNYNLLNLNSENQAQNQRQEFFRNIGDQELYEYALVSIERNRIANYCKCKNYLKEETETLKNINQWFERDYHTIKKSKQLRIQDKALFCFYHISPNLCAKLLWGIYIRNEKRKVK